MKKELEILHLEDNKLDAEIIKNILQDEGIEYNINIVNNQNEYQSLLLDNDYDIILSDHTLSGYDGISALKFARENKPHIPFIFISGTIGEERAIAALRNGAKDYVLKNNLDKLVPAIQRVIAESEINESRMKAERALRESEILYTTLFEFASDAIIVVNKYGKIEKCNSLVKNIFGYEKNELIDQTVDFLIPTGFKENLMENWEEFFLNPQTRIKVKEYNLFARRKDNPEFPVEVSLSAVKHSKGDIIQVSIRDITSRKQAELEIKTAKEKAEEISRIKTYFLANINHELRTPLISIHGFSEILFDELDDITHKEFANNIFNASKRLETTIMSMLSMQELEKESLDISRKEIDLVKFINKKSVEYKQIAKEKNLEFKLEIENNDIKLNTDQALIEKIIKNIFDNAVKFTTKGSVVINVSLQEEAGYNSAIIKIKDTGIGIKKEVIENIFSPFRQASEGHSRSYEGMGLGLSVAKQYLDHLGGKIEIISEVGKGTVIEIKLPVLYKESEIVEKINDKKATYVEEVEEQVSSNPLILMVEDNLGNRVLFKKYLENEFNLDQAEDGISAIANAELKQYELILMDINLGSGIDGIETFHRIRKLPKYENIPVIAVTAFGLKEDKKRFLDEGFTDYMQKPVNKDELIELINELILANKR